MKRKALGKGLSALLPEPEAAVEDVPSAGEVPIDRLEPNPDQPRARFAAAGLDELAASIRQSGIVQPIVVRPVGDRLQIIAGERRWRAARQAGLATVPVSIREVADDRLLELALIENIQREDLSPVEEARAYQRLVDELHLTQDEVAAKVGKDRSTVANTLRLLRLPTEVQDLVGEGKLGAGHARPLLALEREGDQVSLAREAVRRGLSAREVESRVAAARAPRPSREIRKDPNTRAAEERLRAVLGTRVEIARRGGKGSIRITFGTEAELNRLFDHITARRSERA